MTDERIRQIVNKVSDGFSTAYFRCDPTTQEALRLATALSKVIDELNDEVETLKQQLAVQAAAASTSAST